MVQSSASNLTICYNTINGGGNPNSLTQPWTVNNFYNSLIGVATSAFVEYNYLLNSVADNLNVGGSTGGGTIVYKYNLLENSGLLTAIIIILFNITVAPRITRRSTLTRSCNCLR